MQQVIDFLFNDFPARWECGPWNPWLVAVYVTPQIMTFIQYWWINRWIGLASEIDGRSEVKKVAYWFRYVFRTCALSHLIGDVFIFYKGIYPITAMWMWLTATIAGITLIRFGSILTSLVREASYNSHLIEEIAGVDSADKILEITQRLKKARLQTKIRV